LWAETITEYSVVPDELTNEQFLDYTKQLSNEPNYRDADIIPFKPRS
jgi:hypothetical protein